MARTCCSLLLLLSSCLSGADSNWLIEDGEPRAEIVIASDAPRMTRLAAEELQIYLEKISGATLPIVSETEASEEQSRILIGQSRWTDQLGIHDEGLAFEAYRIVTRPGTLVLLGNDRDFVPPEPWARRRNDIDRARAEWDQITQDRTDTAWGFPMQSIWRSYNLATETWAQDSGGSLQAVYGFLRRLGVRWYMPGKLGEVVPEQTSIELPDLDLTVHPDYALRQYLGPSIGNASRETILWGRRIGLNDGYELLGTGPRTHGFSRVHARREMQSAHPDFYALIGRERDTGTRGTGHACWSSAGLEEEAVGYVKTLFDHYREPALQLSPQDGLRMCQCEDCSAMTPSNAVWGFLDRVARRTLQSHPEQNLIGAAYSSYREPPASIDQLSPNVIVRINNVGRPQFRDPAHWMWYRELIEEWRSKIASGKIIRVENNYYESVIHPRSIARDLREMKGFSLGEMSEVARADDPSGRGQTWGRPGTNHLNLYINARYLWDADQDIEKVLEEYYGSFYGPAAGAMRTAFDYAENHYSVEGKSKLELPARVRLLELLHAARDAAEQDSVYRQRIELIISEFSSLDDLRQRLTSTQKRENVPQFEPWNLGNGKWDEARAAARIDGKLDEPFWTFRGMLREADGEKPEELTRFQILHHEEALWIGIRGEMSEPFSSAEAKQDDPETSDGERIEFLLETDAHAYYRIAVSPEGVILDEDRSEEDNASGVRWNSNAEVVILHGDGEFTLEMRIPLVPELEGAGDPFHHILYRRPPSQLWPWYFNLVRVNKDESGTTVSAFYPVEEAAILDRFSMARLAR